VKKLLTFLGWPLLVLPLLLSSLGASLNEVAAVSNGGVMPVYSQAYANSLDYQEAKAEYEYLKDGKFPEEPDYIHVLATSKTKYHYLCDIFPSDGGIFSVGDYLQSMADDAKYICGGLWLSWIALFLIRRKYLNQVERSSWNNDPTS
jgi:hypothetical protein